MMRAYLPTALRSLPRRPHPWVMVWTLAVAQVISWGTLFYAFSLFVLPMQESLGWSRPLLNGALSLGLLCTSVVAFPVGAWIDRYGGRGVMTLGSLIGGLLLLAWAQVETPWVFYLLWVLIGVSMAGVLYEPAFAVITAVFGPDARRGITALTLVGGFASTVFMPLTQLLIGAVGWRNTLLVLGGLNLAVCLPLHALFVPASPASRLPEAPQADAPTAHAWARRGIVEPALRALLYVDQHPATLARDKHFNATLLATLRETLGPAIISAAAAWGKTKQLDEVVTWIDNNAGYGACASGTI